jgi:hypothetical protein
MTHGYDHDHERMPEEQLPLLEVLRRRNPAADQESVSHSLRHVQGVVRARPEVFAGLKSSLSKSASLSLFDPPSLFYRSETQKEQLLTLWDEAEKASKVQGEDVEKLDSLEQMVASGWSITFSEKRMMEAIADQVRSKGVEKGYLLDGEKSLLNEGWKYREDFAEYLSMRAPNGPTFADLGLEWKFKNERWEPAKSWGRYKDSTFTTLSSRYFQNLLKKLQSEPDTAKREILGNIYRRCEGLSKLREHGNLNESHAGWSNLLAELYNTFPPPDKMSPI